MDGSIVIDTEAILAELRKTAGPLPESVREYIFRYYPEFAALRQVDRLVQLVQERFGIEITKARMQGLVTHGRKPC